MQSAKVLVFTVEDHQNLISYRNEQDIFDFQHVQLHIGAN